RSTASTCRSRACLSAGPLTSGRSSPQGSIPPWLPPSDDHFAATSLPSALREGIQTCLPAQTASHGEVDVLLRVRTLLVDRPQRGVVVVVHELQVAAARVRDMPRELTVTVVRHLAGRHRRPVGPHRLADLPGPVRVPLQDPLRPVLASPSGN